MSAAPRNSGKPCTLSTAFIEWALPKLRPLVDAHYEDKQKNVVRQGAFYALLDHYMAEFDGQPFAKPDFDGNPRNTDGSLLLFDALKTLHKSWFRNHSALNKLSTLTKYEDRGGVSEDNPLRATGPSELWATIDANKARLNEAIASERTGEVPTPGSSLGLRKSVLARLFKELPDDERKIWIELAQKRKEDEQRRATAVSVVQDRQKALPGYLADRIDSSLRDRGLGQTYVVLTLGFYVGEEDRRVHRFRSLLSASPKTQKRRLFESESWKTKVEPVWSDFIDKEIQYLWCEDLPALPDDARGAALVSFRKELRLHFEDLFMLVTETPFGAPLRAQFWRDIAEDPNEFVSPSRIPKGAVFRNPEEMAEDAFIILYDHVRTCQLDRTTIDESLRFCFHQPCINRARGVYRAQVTEKKRQAKASEDTAAKSGSSPPVPSAATAAASAAAAVHPRPSGPADNGPDEHPLPEPSPVPIGPEDARSSTAPMSTLSARTADATASGTRNTTLTASGDAETEQPDIPVAAGVKPLVEKRKQPPPDGAGSAGRAAKKAKQSPSLPATDADSVSRGTRFADKRRPPVEAKSRPKKTPGPVQKKQ